jgi:8-oxo-dGTP pyrophosphatase MutT (NUDIX family)
MPPDDRSAKGEGHPNRSAEIMPWRRTGDRTVLRDRWIHLRAERWETPRGVSLDPWWMLDWPNLVHVVALTPDDRLVLVRQFRPGAGLVTLELPGGIIESGESDPVAAGRREFTEETGYTALEFRHLVDLPPDPAHCSNRLHFVLALGCSPERQQVLDPGEDIALATPTVAEVLAGLGQGVMQNATHVGGLLLGLRAAGRLAW